MSKLLALVVAFVTLSTPAWADVVTFGSLDIDWVGVGTVQLNCPSLIYTGTVGANDGVYTAWRLGPALGSDGATVNMGGYWTGHGVRGDVTSGAATIPVGSDNYWGDLRFNASVALPTSPMGTEIWLDQPFTFNGFFKLPTGQVGLDGDGMLTAMFRRGPDSWDLRSAHYAFSATPEPGAWILLLTGLGVLTWIRLATSARLTAE